MISKTIQLNPFTRSVEMRKSAKERGDLKQADDIRKEINSNFSKLFNAPFIIDEDFNTHIRPDLAQDETFKAYAEEMAKKAKEALSRGEEDQARFMRRMMESPYGKRFK